MIKNLAIGGGSNRLLLIFALVLGLLCAILVGVYLSGLSSSDTTPTTTTTVPVVVALQDIPPLTVVTDTMLTVKTVPTDLAVLGAFTKPADAVGQTAQVQITVGEQVLPSKVTSTLSAASLYGNNVPLSLLLPTGARAFSIAVSQVTSAGGLVRAGDYVDIISGTSHATNAPGATNISSCYVLQDVQVLVVGGTLANPKSQTNAAALAATLPDPAASVMTFAVTPQNASVLAAAQGGTGNGSLLVALRPFGEHGPAAGNLPACGS
ncbi:MAG TPA: Flp pilus assembly protein CpaB [Dehalococcoidia bacterium]